MRTVIQRVNEAQVIVEGQTIASIGSGLVILLGIENEDTPAKKPTNWSRRSPTCASSAMRKGK